MDRISGGALAAQALVVGPPAQEGEIGRAESAAQPEVFGPKTTALDPPISCVFHSFNFF